MPIVTAHIKFSIYTTFLDGAFQAEDERLPDESIEDGVLRVRKHLENAVAILKKEHEGMRGVQETSQHFHGLSPIPENQKPQPAEINIQHERIQIAIENAKTPEELKKVKEDHPIMPVPLMTFYNNKMQQLTNINIP
jgi:hypothetical protein